MKNQIEKVKEISIPNRSYIIIAKKSNKAKRIRISINKNSEISLIIPIYQSYKLATNFLLSKINWIDKALIKINDRKINAEKNKKNQKEKQIFLNKDQIELYSKILIDRCKELAQKHNFINIGNITIRSQKTLWGSCSRNNNISLNINLIKLKQELIDYVILHELTHIKIKNHSKKFWQKLDQINPDPKFFDKQLKEYSPNYKIKSCI